MLFVSAVFMLHSPNSDEHEIGDSRYSIVTLCHMI